MSRHTREWNKTCTSEYDFCDFEQLVETPLVKVPCGQFDRMSYLRSAYKILQQEVNHRQEPFTDEETRAMRQLRSDADKLRCTSLAWGDREEITEFARQWTLCRFVFVVQCFAHVLLDLHGCDEESDRFERRWAAWEQRYREWWIDHELLLRYDPLREYDAQDAWSALQRLTSRWNEFMEPIPAVEALYRGMEMHVAREVVFGEAGFSLKKKFTAECMLRYMSGMFMRFRYLQRDMEWTRNARRMGALQKFTEWFEGQIGVLHSREFRISFRDRMVDWLVPLGSMEWARFDENVKKAKGFYLITHLQGIGRTNALRQYMVTGEFGDKSSLLSQMFFLAGFAMIMDSRNVPFETDILFLERDKDPGEFYDEDAQQNMIRSNVPLLVQNFNGLDVYYEGAYINTREVRLALYVWLWIVHHQLYDHVHGIHIGDITKPLWSR